LRRLFPFCEAKRPFRAGTNGVYIAVVLQSFVQRRENENFAYNTKPISKGRHHLIRHYFDQGAKSEGFCRGTLAFLDPSMGKAKSAQRARAACTLSRKPRRTRGAAAFIKLPFLYLSLYKVAINEVSCVLMKKQNSSGQRASPLTGETIFLCITHHTAIWAAQINSQIVP